jgi:regulator of nucleoside diphosphate kinase
MKDEILVSKVDYKRLNSMILRLLEMKNANLIELNRLNMEIKRAIVIEPWKMESDYITMNSEIKFTHLGTGATSTVRLVYPQDAGLNEGNISVLSPLGCALLGNRKGQTISFNAPGGNQRVIIDEIVYQPEANGIDLQE